MDTTPTDDTAVVALTGEDVLALAKTGYEEVLEVRRRVIQAEQEARRKEDAYIKELRQQLQGKVVDLTAYTEATEFMDQDGPAMRLGFGRVENERFIIRSVFMTQEDSPTRKRSPLVYATRRRHGKSLYCGDISFRLDKVRKLDFVESEEESAPN